MSDGTFGNFTRPQSRFVRQPITVLALYVLALLREFRWTLIGLVSAVIFGGVLYRITPHEAFHGQRPPIWLALYGGWMAMLAQPLVNPPETWYLTLLCGFYPLLGAVIVGEGVVRLAMLMISKRRGEKEWTRVTASTYRDHVVLCGIGNLGYRVLEYFVSIGTPVVALEKRRGARFLVQAKELGVPVMIRDMKEDQALIDAGIKYARAIVIATNDPLANIEVALDAKRMNPTIRVVMRMFDEAVALKMTGVLAVGTAFSSSTLAAPAIASMALLPDPHGARVLSSVLIDGVPHVSAEITLPSEHWMVGKTIAAAEADAPIRILARGVKSPSPPAPTQVLDAGDRLVIHLPASRMDALASR